MDQNAAEFLAEAINIGDLFDPYRDIEENKKDFSCCSKRCLISCCRNKYQAPYLSNMGDLKKKIFHLTYETALIKTINQYLKK